MGTLPKLNIAFYVNIKLKKNMYINVQEYFNSHLLGVKQLCMKG